MKALKIDTIQYDGQEDGTDTVVIELDSGDICEVQRLNGCFNQQYDCQLSKNGEMNPTFDEVSEFVVKIANEAE